MKILKIYVKWKNFESSISKKFYLRCIQDALKLKCYKMANVFAKKGEISNGNSNRWKKFKRCDSKYLFIKSMTSTEGYTNKMNVNLLYEFDKYWVIFIYLFLNKLNVARWWLFFLFIWCFIFFIILIL